MLHSCRSSAESGDSADRAERDREEGDPQQGSSLLSSCSRQLFICYRRRTAGNGGAHVGLALHDEEGDEGRSSRVQACYMRMQGWERLALASAGVGGSVVHPPRCFGIWWRCGGVELDGTAVVHELGLASLYMAP
jgi:hypothetical protein